MASEKGTAQTKIYLGVVGLLFGVKKFQYSRNFLESYTIVGDSPVYEILKSLRSILSRAGHVKPCLNLRGPSRKAKYSLVTDSEQVP